MRPATRIRSIVSASLTSGSPVFGCRLPTYSGTAMFAGTWRSGEIRPGWSSVAMIWECSAHERRAAAMVVLPEAHGRRARRGLPGQGPAGSLPDQGGGGQGAGDGPAPERGVGRAGG